MTQLSQRQRNILIHLCLALAVAAAYWPVRHFEFTNLDDTLYVTNNPRVQQGLTGEGFAWAFTTSYPAYWQPLAWLSHMLDCQLFGLKAGMHHLTNVLFHIANTLLLFAILNKMTRAPWRSAFAAALFALHPLHVGSVAWVAERKDLLSATFWMLTIGAYVRYVERPDRHRYWLTLGLYVMGLMAKPMLVTLPFVLLLLDYWPLGRTRWLKSVVGDNAQASPGKLLVEKLPFLALSVVSSVWTFRTTRTSGAVYSLETMSVGSRVANAAVSYVRYLGKTFWPRGLAVFYPQQSWSPLVMLGAIAILVGITGVALWRARREPQFVVGWLLFLGMLAPVNGLVQVGSQSMADHYLYLPLLGLFMMVAWGIPDRAVERRGRKMIVAAAATLSVGVCAVLCRFQVGYWKNSETLFRHALEVTQDNYLAHLNLGKALSDVGDVQEAIEHYEQSIRIKSDYALSHDNLGSALAQAGRLHEAVEQFDLALQLQPDMADAHCNMGRALVQLGRLPEAIGHYEQAVRLNPDDADAHYNLGNALLASGRVPEAAEHWEQAVRIQPDHVEARNNLAAALAQAGRLQEAVEQFDQVVRITPGDAEAHYNLGLALEQTGRVREAIAHYEQALRIKPDDPAARNKLAWLLATFAPTEGGDPVRAVTLAEQACKLTDNRVAPYLDTLAAAYAATGRFNDAIAAAQKAVEFANSVGQPQVATQIESRLELYRAGRPYRQPIDVASPLKP